MALSAPAPLLWFDGIVVVASAATTLPDFLLGTGVWADSMNASSKCRGHARASVVTRRASAHLLPRSSRRSRSRKRTRCETPPAAPWSIKARILAKTASKRGPKAQSERPSKAGPATVRSAQSSSSASSGQAVRPLRSSSEHVSSNFGESMPRTRSQPTNFILPKDRCLRRMRASSRASTSPLSSSAASFWKRPSKERWQWSRSLRRKRSPLAAASAAGDGGAVMAGGPMRGSDAKRTQRSTYMPMNLCCSVAFPNISETRIATCSGVLTPQAATFS
mmetsp:Transcript_51772/g.110755  ORF Transcript_51772/g.110755 Transcript_51772/m.110755 type:complete len:277 (+) Transcript_51772:698-1528(+)